MTTTTTPATTTTLTTEAAEDMHSALVKGVRDMLTARRSLVKAIKAAKAADLHAARGFSSWTEYATATLEATLPKGATKSEREWVAVVFVHFGVSQRDAAKATDTSVATVNRRVKAKGAEVAAEVAEATGDAADATPATTTTDKRGVSQSRDSKRGKGKPAAPKGDAPKAETPKASKPVAQPKRTAWAQAQDAMGVLIAAWPNLSLDQQAEVADMLGSLEMRQD
jgi:hypothetical protein